MVPSRSSIALDHVSSASNRGRLSRSCAGITGPIFRHAALALLLLLAFSVTARAASDSAFTLFEAGQVRPLAQSPDGSTLFAVNTPDNALEVFEIESQGLRHIASIPVGLEPVAVAARNDDEVWVVNHVSDSVSVVDVRRSAMRVVRTLLVGDEPRDIVFAGPRRERAFITTAHRGQNIPFDPQFSTPGIGRADVWVFDAAADTQRRTLGGLPLAIVTLFTDTPRALAVSPDGSRVYAAGFLSGNRTTTIPEGIVTKNGGLPGPLTNSRGVQQPPTSLIVKFDGAHWRDELGRAWDRFVRFSLPDKDVFVIDANASPPKLVAGRGGFYSGVGTVIYNMAVNPKNGHVYVANTEALNEKRFSGPGTFAGHTVRGHLHESRITVLGVDRGVAPRHLNKHIDYSKCCAPVPNDENRRSLALPMGMTVTSDGSTLYVAAFGSSKVGVFHTKELENDSFVPSVDSQIAVSGGGPSGLLLDEAHQRLYVLTRFNNAIAVVDTEKRAEVASVAMLDPEPDRIVKGRRFFYDASFTSSHGDSACASCHVFGDFDGLAWDLGNPDDVEIKNPGPFRVTPAQAGSTLNPNFPAMKGPMVTQSMRGLPNHGAMHWRGDRTGGNDAETAQPDGGAFDEVAAFKQFSSGFTDLLGRSEPLVDGDMQALTDFVMQMMYAPNPNRNLDDSLTPDQQAGHDFFFGQTSDVLTNCVGCHVLDRKGNAELGVAKPGFFGTTGKYAFEFETQVLKIPQLRNVYQKVGMFGMSQWAFFPPDYPNAPNRFMGDQIRGFGILHDGAVDNVFRFMTSSKFGFMPPGPSGKPLNPGGFSLDPAQGNRQRRQVEAYVLAFDSNFAPIVGQQVTLTPHNRSEANPRIDLLVARAGVGECDLVARRSRSRGYLYIGNGMFRRSTGARTVTDAALRDQVHRDGLEVTYTCTPRGSGARLAADRGEADGGAKDGLD